MNELDQKIFEKIQKIIGNLVNENNSKELLANLTMDEYARMIHILKNEEIPGIDEKMKSATLAFLELIKKRIEEANF